MLETEQSSTLKFVCHFCYLQDFKESMKQCSAKIAGSLEVLEKDLANHLTKILNKEGDSFIHTKLLVISDLAISWSARVAKS